MPLRTFALSFTLLFALAPRGDTFTVSPASCTLRIQASGIRNQRGNVAAAIYASPQGWPERRDKAYAVDSAPIMGDHALLTFHLPPAKYGVVVIHDENENEKLDRNLLGIPKEGFGFANNPRVLLIAPDFQDAAINVGCPVTNIDVKLIYK